MDRAIAMPQLRGGKPEEFSDRNLVTAHHLYCGGKPSFDSVHIMQYRNLGATGLKVSELSLGCMTFGRESSEQESHSMIDKFIEVGGNFLDTANVYAAGASEEILGRALKHHKR